MASGGIGAGAPGGRLIERVPLGAAITDSGVVLDRFVRWVADTGLSPYAHQEEALLELAAGKHVVLATPTGSGKSLVALGLHFKALCEGKRSFYTFVPMLFVAAITIWALAAIAANGFASAAALDVAFWNGTSAAVLLALALLLGAIAWRSRGGSGERRAGPDPGAVTD